MNGSESDKLLAAIDFIRRCGASQVQVRYSDDEEPAIWFVVAKFDKKKRPMGVDGIEVDASTNPTRAALRLCERLCDGGLCTYCHKPAALEPDSLSQMPFDHSICWYQYDPELKKFRRGCE